MEMFELLYNNTYNSESNLLRANFVSTNFSEETFSSKQTLDILALLTKGLETQTESN